MKLLELFRLVSLYAKWKEGRDIETEEANQSLTAAKFCITPIFETSNFSLLSTCSHQILLKSKYNSNFEGIVKSSYDGDLHLLSAFNVELSTRKSQYTIVYFLPIQRIQISKLTDKWTFHFYFRIWKLEKYPSLSSMCNWAYIDN